MTRTRLIVLLSAASVASMLTFVFVPQASPQLGECALTFDNAGALGAIAQQAAATFAPGGYTMPCSSHSLNVESVTWGHFHLNFEDPSVSCMWAEEGGIVGYGRDDGSGGCLPVDWDHEPRYLVSHKNDKWIKIWLEDGSSHQPRAFDLRRMHVGAGPPIQLWFQKQDGTWWFWDQLKGAKNWKLEQWSKDVVEVRIRGSSGSSGPYVIRNAYVK